MIVCLATPLEALLSRLNNPFTSISLTIQCNPFHLQAAIPHMNISISNRAILSICRLLFRTCTLAYLTRHARWIEFIRNVSNSAFRSTLLSSHFISLGLPILALRHIIPLGRSVFIPVQVNQKFHYIFLLLSSIYIYPDSPFHLAICHNQYSTSFSYHSVELKNHCLTR